MICPREVITLAEQRFPELAGERVREAVAVVESGPGTRKSACLFPWGEPFTGIGSGDGRPSDVLGRRARRGAGLCWRAGRAQNSSGPDGTFVRATEWIYAHQGASAGRVHVGTTDTGR